MNIFQSSMLNFFRLKEMRAYGYFALCFVCILICSYNDVIAVFSASSIEQKLYTPVLSYYNPKTIGHIFIYIFSIVLFYFSLLAIIHFEKSKLISLFSKNDITLFLYGLVICSLLLSRFLPVKSYLFVVMLAIFAPFLSLYCINTENNCAQKNYMTALKVCATGIACLFYFLAYAPFIFNDPILTNDYFRIPEQYRASESEKYESSTDIINKKQYFYSEKIDITTAHQWKNNSACTAVPIGNKQIEHLADDYSKYNRLAATPLFSAPAQYIYYPLLEYVEDRLCITPADSPGGTADLVHNRLLQTKLQSLSITPPESLLRSLRSEPVHIEEDPYLYDSFYEMALQINGRGVYKHYAHYILPAFEFTLGKPLQSISHQYGLAITVIIGKITQTLSEAGSFEFSKFYQVINSLWYIDFIIFLVCISLIYKNWHTISLFLVFFVVTKLFFLCVKDITQLAAGHFLFRVLLYSPTLALMYFYSVTKHKKYLAGIVVASFVAAFCNLQFGIFIPLACAATFFVQDFILEKRYRQAAFDIIILLITTGLSLYIFSIGHNKAQGPFVQGIFSFNSVGLKELTVFSLQFVVYLILYYYLYKEKKPTASILLFSSIYAQMILLYYIRMSFIDAFSPFLNIIYMPIMIWIASIAFEKSSFLKRFTVSTAFTVMSVSTIIFFILHHHVYHAKLYQANLQTHKLYDWNFKNMKLKSTIDPAYFQDAINTIHKYVPVDSSISIVSQYDSLLTYLSGKISSTHFDVLSILYTDKVRMKMEKEILQNKPKYIFVDSDINKPYILDILPISFSNVYLHLESRNRALVLQKLRKIYQTVTQDYELVEKGLLISVYRRKDMGQD